ncbi:MAG: hypothetical protein HC866_22300 [Leptolyngbyaceae cyanobacterium RU_5_1]|nr:hypothetical protein [Leptolyngbyaceae cyanobacterium RU_5_1]
MTDPKRDFRGWIAIAGALLSIPTATWLNIPTVSPAAIAINRRDAIKSPTDTLRERVSTSPLHHAQRPTPPFPLDGKPVYVLQSGKWQEALLMGYGWSSQAGFRYDVRYLSDNRTERGVLVDRLLSLTEAQRRGIAKRVYDVSNQTGIQQMVNAHNEWRTRYGVPAVTWSPQLAAYAQEWANTLLREDRFGHRPQSPYGENLAWAGGQQMSPERVVRMWGEEVKDYNYTTNTCKPGKVCGHYTQIVWRNTKQIGCGVARGNGKEIWVCNYNPPGNVIGRKPY